MKQFKLSLAALFFCCFGILKAQTPTYGVTNFNDANYDGISFVSGPALPSILKASNVAASGFDFYLGALGIYSVTQINHGSATYNGGITATNLSTGASIYQSFGFATIPVSGVYPKFKLNSVKIRVTNIHPTNPQLLSIAGIVGTNAGGFQPLLAMPGTNWYTLNTISNAVFNNINSVMVLNGNGVDLNTASQFISEIVIDDIDIAAPQTSGGSLPTFSTHPSNQTVCVGSNATFNVAATGATSYSWFVSNDGVIWTPITIANAGTTFSGYATSTLTVNNASLLLNNLYLFANATNATGNQASNVARLFVNNPITVGAISGPASLCVGQTGNYSSTTPGGIWRINGRGTISNSGVVLPQSAGSTSITYTVTQGGCTASANRTVTFNALPAIPNIAYAAGNLVNPQLGAGSGNMCRNRTFNVVGIPAGGTFNGTGTTTTKDNGTVTFGAGTAASGTIMIGNSTGAGSFSYSISNGSGCASIRFITYNTVACVPRGSSSNNTIFNNDIIIYPNPAKNIVNIKQNFVTAGTRAVIVDMLGKQIKSQFLSMGNNTIDISNLSKGLYTLNIISNEGNKTQKLIVE